MLLEDQPERYEYVAMGGFGMAARPHIDGLEVWSPLYLISGSVMEGGVVDDAVRPAICIVLCQVMGKVVLAERSIVGPEPS